MRTDFYYDSCGIGRIHACRWMPEGTPRGVVQIVHGIAERVERYDLFAQFLTANGFLVVAEDHMGHGRSINDGGIQGYFHGGWFAAVDDSVRLMKDTMAEYPDVPYVLFGHSMGSFMARTILARYPDSGIRAAIICGTGWQPKAALPVIVRMADMICKKTGETNVSEQMQGMMFSGYTKRIPDARTPSDWLTRDPAIVDAYIADPLCGFTPTCGLLRDMVKGISYIEQNDSLNQMKKHLPVLFIAGEEDPVGSYGKGVRQAAQAFRKAGMINVAVKLYPDCRHEILNELNKEIVFRDVLDWIELVIPAEKN